jgi:hypothetical protein
MSKPIYKLWIIKNTPELMSLIAKDPEAVARAQASSAQSLKEVGGKLLVYCESLWSSEEYAVFGVEEFPDLEAVQKHTANMMQGGWFQFSTSFSLLGTKPE